MCPTPSSLLDDSALVANNYENFPIIPNSPRILAFHIKSAHNMHNRSASERSAQKRLAKISQQEEDAKNALPFFIRTKDA